MSTKEKLWLLTKCLFYILGKLLKTVIQGIRAWLRQIKMDSDKFNKCTMADF